jgi:hypothetical protein
MSNFHALQEAAQRRNATTINSETVGKTDRDDSAGRRAFVLRFFGHFERTCDADASGEKAMTDDLKLPLPDQRANAHRLVHRRSLATRSRRS